MEGLVNGAIEGFINGFTTGALMFCASQAILALSKAASGRCSAPSNCFIAGTLVLTSLGKKKIEDIKVGDEVLAYDEEAGEKSIKRSC
ncbi:MAG: Hint domain-containing protein [Bacilli bacterium]